MKYNNEQYNRKKGKKEEGQNRKEKEKKKKKKRISNIMIEDNILTFYFIIFTLIQDNKVAVASDKRNMYLANEGLVVGKGEER